MSSEQPEKGPLGWAGRSRPKTLPGQEEEASLGDRGGELRLKQPSRGGEEKRQSLRGGGRTTLQAEPSCCRPVTQSRPTLCDPVDFAQQSSVHGISQARIPEWVAISFSNES